MSDPGPNNKGAQMDDLTLQRLVDRAAIIDVVCAFAVSLDTRNWELLRSTLADPIEVDYPDSVGVGTFAAEDLVATAQKFFGRSTQHCTSAPTTRSSSTATMPRASRRCSPRTTWPAPASQGPATGRLLHQPPQAPGRALANPAHRSSTRAGRRATPRCSRTPRRHSRDRRRPSGRPRGRARRLQRP